MKKNSLLFNKKGQMAKQGVDLGIAAIFILAIGLNIAQDVIDNLSLTGITGTVAGFVSLIIVAGFIFFVAKLFGMF